jgi:NAD-dependent dihydropyrimidine dehydrogenase PreA subunit
VVAVWVAVDAGWVGDAVPVNQARIEERPNKKLGSSFGISDRSICLKGGYNKCFTPTIDQEKCIGCGDCVDICPSEVLEIVHEKAEAVNAEEYVDCESCVEVCEQEAITVKEV